MDPKIKRLADIGEALHGKNWQSRLAADLGLSAGYMSQLVSGARRVTPDVEELLVTKIVLNILPRLRWTMDRLEDLAADISIENSNGTDDLRARFEDHQASSKRISDDAYAMEGGASQEKAARLFEAMRARLMAENYQRALAKMGPA